MISFQDLFNKLMSIFLNATTSFTYRNNWVIKLSLICYLIIIFFSFPSYNEIKVKPHNTWKVVQQQIDDPTIQYGLDNPESHNAKRTFRLTIPFLFKIFHINNPVVIYLFQQVVLLLFFVLLILFCKDFFPASRSLWVITPVAVCFTYMGQVGIIDVFAKFDSIALCCILAAMYVRNVFFIFFLALAASFIDERGFIALMLIYLWWQIRHRQLHQFGFRELLQPNWQSMSIVLAGISYLLIRFYLIYKYHFITVTGGVGLGILKSQFNKVLFGLWTAFEGFWLLILIAFFVLLRNKQLVLTIFILMFACPSVLSSFLVMDITRSLIYCLPVLIMSMYIISKSEQPDYSLKLILFVMMINILVPTYMTEGGFRIEGVNPIFFRIFSL